MAVICDDIGMLFFCVPKTASTACTQFLIEHAGGVDIPRLQPNRDLHYYWQYKHCTLRDLIVHGHLTRKQSGQLLKVAAVRNPYDWVASRYSFERAIHEQVTSGDAQPWMQIYISALDFSTQTSFREYVYHHYAGKTRSVMGDIGKGIDHVLRFERMQRDLKGVLTKLGHPVEAEIPEINVSATRKRGNWKDLYDISMMNVIEQCFAEDFDRFGYTFEDEYSEEG